MFDEFDGVILSILQQGHFDEPLLKCEAAKVDEALKASDENKSFSDAWDIYHDSFDDNGDEVAERLANAVRTTPKAISPLNLSGTISLLKDISWKGDIKALIESYIAGRSDASPEFWDLDESAFGEDVRDPDVRAAFQAKLTTVQVQPKPAELLIELGRTRTWNEEDLTFLGKLTIDELYSIFKELRDTDLKRAVAGALLFRNMAAASDSMQQLVSNATEALIKISAESPINRRRVLQKGVELPVEAPIAPPVIASDASPVNEDDSTSPDVAQDQQ